MDELVSIIVPVYNAASYIENTIEMVRRQTHSDWELILVDDASTDESVAVIRRMLGEGDIRLIQKSHNEGAAAARNTGLDAARGRYIAFLDADDVWMPDKLLRELAFMKDRQAGFVFSAYEFGDEEARGTGKIVHVPDKLTYHEALTRTVIFTTTVLIDRERIPDELIRMPEVESEDTATWWQILRAGHTACGLDEVLAIYRRPAKSLSSNKLAAIRRIWRLYRRQEGLSVMHSAWCFLFWAYRATARRI
jgi:teichuronic acid biosynthesis glycosyltransferase TuaG